MKHYLTWKYALLSSVVLVLLLVVAVDPAFAAYGDGSGEYIFDERPFQVLICNVINFIEGYWGGVILVLSCVVCICSAAVGAYRMTISAMCVCVGCFGVRVIVTLFFDIEVISGEYYYRINHDGGPSEAWNKTSPTRIDQAY